jgi:hypothetical protein
LEGGKLDGILGYRREVLTRFRRDSERYAERDVDLAYYDCDKHQKPIIIGIVRFPAIAHHDLRMDDRLPASEIYSN